jgi:hypothetical protein
LDLPWLCIGDFNEVLSAEEHFGGNQRDNWQIAQFQDVVADCGFSDLGFSGLPYTWDNRQEADRNVMVRLDWALGDPKFIECFGGTNVVHVPTVFSNHSALLVEVKEDAHRGSRQRKVRPFHYENMWQRHEAYTDFVNQSWDCCSDSVGLDGLAKKLASLQGAFRSWDMDVFGSIRGNLKKLREDLAKERSHTMYRGPTEREQRLMQELAELTAREGEMERQRSHMDWLKSGDKNTGFFQAKAKIRGRTNRIRALRTADGSLATYQGVMEQMASDFYMNLFTAQEHLQPDLIYQYTPRKISAHMGEMLEEPFTAEEVKAALFQMKPNKTPGEDGFTAGFFSEALGDTEQ